MHKSLKAINTARYTLGRREKAAVDDEHAAARQEIIGNIVNRIPHTDTVPGHADAF